MIDSARYGVVTAPGTVRFERLLPGPIERVWSYLVDPDKRAKWFAGGAMQLKAGGTLVLEFKHSNLSPGEATPERFREMADGLASPGGVIRCEAPHLLTFWWENDQWEVTFELTAQGSEVLLVLTHANLATRKGMLSVSSGWHSHLEILEAQLVGASSPRFWESFLAREQDYEGRIPLTSAAAALGNSSV